MDKEQVLIDNIMKCTKYEEHRKSQMNIGSDEFGYSMVNTEQVLYKENAILIKIKENGYADLDELNNIMDLIHLK